MPTSEKQIAANRRNAQKSTGPRTPEGKKAVSRNAIKHGLNVCDIILKSPHLSEDPDQYKRLVDSLLDELKPKGVIQEHLVLKIANSLWRYQRVINAETARINDQLETAAYDIEHGDLHYVTYPSTALRVTRSSRAPRAEREAQKGDSSPTRIQPCRRPVGPQ